MIVSQLLPGSRGFSLIEVIVSILFLSITITGFARLYTNMNSRVEMMRWKQSALQVAQQEMEKYTADPQRKFKSLEIIDIYGIRSIKETRKNSDESFECKIKQADRENILVSLRTIWGN